MQGPTILSPLRGACNEDSNALPKGLKALTGFWSRDLPVMRPLIYHWHPVGLVSKSVGLGRPPRELLSNFSADLRARHCRRCGLSVSCYLDSPTLTTNIQQQNKNSFKKQKKRVIKFRKRTVHDLISNTYLTQHLILFKCYNREWKASSKFIITSKID